MPKYRVKAVHTGNGFTSGSVYEFTQCGSRTQYETMNDNGHPRVESADALFKGARSAHFLNSQDEPKRNCWERVE